MFGPPKGFFDNSTALTQLDAAAADRNLLPEAVSNIRTWLTDPCYGEYVELVAQDLANEKWKELNDAFWKVIPFGTGGRRGVMYPIGTNAINDRTIGESAAGLANYVKLTVKNQALSCAIAYDTRHRSRHFAELCSEIMVAAGFKVFFLDGYRSTPQLSFVVRAENCACGIMITASHNPPSDNAVKAYWLTGGQLIPPDDVGVIEEVANVREIKRAEFDKALADGQIVYCQKEMDEAFQDAVLMQSAPGPRKLKIIYSPLHGVGASAVLPVLARDGFNDVELYARHAKPHPDFPNVPDNIANPENPRVFDEITERAKQIDANLVLATDPDCDRLGCASPLSLEPGSDWGILTGNQIGALLAEHLLSARQAANSLTPDSYVVKTLVTTELIRRIANAYGVQTAGNLLVGFKWIGAEIDTRGPENFVLGAEESYGFLAGSHVRDKDASVAAMLLSELTAQLKSQGVSLHEKLDDLFRQYGCHSEHTVSVYMKGAEGMDKMKGVMGRFRSNPPKSLGGQKVVRVRDYLSSTSTEIGQDPKPFDGPKGDMVILDMENECNYVAVRPSGTEPKVKFYMFAYDSPETSSSDLAATKANQIGRIASVEAGLRAFASV